MNVAKLKELIQELPDEMPVHLVEVKSEPDEFDVTKPIQEIFTSSAENHDGELTQVVIITF